MSTTGTLSLSSASSARCLLMWRSMDTEALGFYERMGFVSHGAPIVLEGELQAQVSPPPPPVFTFLASCGEADAMLT